MDQYKKKNEECNIKWNGLLWSMIYYNVRWKLNSLFVGSCHVTFFIWYPLPLEIVMKIPMDQLLLSLNKSKSTGMDGIQAKFLKDGSVFKFPLAHIINLRFQVKWSQMSLSL